MDSESQKRSKFLRDKFINFSSIKDMDNLEEVAKEIVWQNFEKLTAFIFEENKFQVEINKIKKFKKKGDNMTLLPRIVIKYF